MTGQQPIEFRSGRLYLSKTVYDDYFAGSNSIILLREDKDLLMLPVRNAGSGGYLIKVRNAAGDRVVSGADFFRDQGLEDHATWCGRHAWCEKLAGLRLYEMFLM
jgi:hypothetical protein